MPCQHRVYKIFLFFLRNKINAVRDAKSLKLQGFSAPKATMSRLRRSSTRFFPALLFSIFPGKHFRPAISQAGVSKRRALLTFSEFFLTARLLFTCKKRAKSCILYETGKKRFYRRVKKVESTDFPPSRRKKCRTCRKLSIARIFLSMAVRGSTKTKGAKTWIVCPMGKTQQK